MKTVIAPWGRGYEAAALDEIANLWNRNAIRRHAFFPWTGEFLRRVWSIGDMLSRGCLLEARQEGVLVGFIHVSWMHEEFYSPAGSVEALLVDAACRGQGIGTSLLLEGIDVLKRIRPALWFVDAMGAWPCGFLYTALADGSERSGVFRNEPGLARLFSRVGFRKVRPSFVMRAPVLAGIPPPSPPEGTSVHLGQRSHVTWLDRVFRARDLWDHVLVDRYEHVLSRAIFGRMPGESQVEGKTIFSLFGVNTPEHLRGKGWAGHNIHLLRHHIATLGGHLIELHVYADNTPALALYRRAGFEEVAETMMMYLDI